MKKIAAIIGVAGLLLIYIATLISAIFTSPYTPQLFKACVYATIIIPVICYGYILMYRVLKARAKSMKQNLPPSSEDAVSKTEKDEPENTEQSE